MCLKSQIAYLKSKQAIASGVLQQVDHLHNSEELYPPHAPPALNTRLEPIMLA